MSGQSFPAQTVAEIAERAYRRGYQQGYTQGATGAELKVDLWKWRYETPASKAICPDTGREMLGLDALARLKMEEREVLAVRAKGGEA